MMEFAGFSEALNTEVQRWQELRSDAVAKLASGLPDEQEESVEKSLRAEFNAHVRRIDSLWRQFSDDHKRFKGMPA